MVLTLQCRLWTWVSRTKPPFCGVNKMEFIFLSRHCSFVQKANESATVHLLISIAIFNIGMGLSCCRLFYRVTLFVRFGSVVTSWMGMWHKKSTKLECYDKNTLNYFLGQSLSMHWGSRYVHFEDCVYLFTFSSFWNYLLQWNLKINLRLPTRCGFASVHFFSRDRKLHQRRRLHVSQHPCGGFSHWLWSHHTLLT